MFQYRFKAVVLAGGRGERLKPITDCMPKSMVRIVGKPVIDYVLEGLSKLPLDEVIVVLSHKKLAKYVEEKWSRALSITIVYQKGEGIDAAILSAKDLVRSPNFILAYGDIVVNPKAYIRTLETHINSGAEASILLSPKLDVESYGVAYISENKIVSISEKPVPEKAESTLAVAGIFVLPSTFLNYVEEHGFTEALNVLAKEYTVVPSFWEDWWVDIGYPWDILKANEYVLRDLRFSHISSKATISSKAVIEGPLIIDDGAEISHYAVIKGPAYIGKNSFIGDHCLIREYTSVEENVTVGAFSEVKHSSIQPNVTVSSYNYIGDTVIGESSVLGPHTVTLNILPSGVKVSRLHPVRVKGKLLTKLGAIIGCNVYIGANSTLFAGSIIKSHEKIKPHSIIMQQRSTL